jgi:hypothetical protein
VGCRGNDPSFAVKPTLASTSLVFAIVSSPC